MYIYAQPHNSVSFLSLRERYLIYFLASLYLIVTLRLSLFSYAEFHILKSFSVDFIQKVSLMSGPVLLCTINTT